MALRQFSTIGLAALAALFITATRVPSADTRSASKRGRTAKSAPATESGDTGAEASNTPTEIVIHRRRIHLRAPEKYQVPMHLDPVRTVRLAAPFDGTVKSILHKPGEHLESSAEVIRMDMTEKQLRLDRAKALYQVAKLEDERSLGEGKTVDDRPAASRQGRTRSGRLLDGAGGHPGSRLIAKSCASTCPKDRSSAWANRWRRVGDTSALTVEIPVDRNSTKAGQPMEIKIEDRTVPATVDAILPLASRFEALRDLVPSAASAVVVVPNTDGRLRPGQTVFSPLDPEGRRRRRPQQLHCQFSGRQSQGAGLAE